MKVIRVIMVVVVIALGNNAFSQAIVKGNVLIDTYYGYPNLYNNVFKSAYNVNTSNYTNININGVGPLGLRGEYLIADKFGLGIDFGFNTTQLTFTEVNTNGVKSVDYDFRTQKVGAMVTLNFHFLQKDNLDLYCTAGGGYGNRTFSYSSSSDPNYKPGAIKSVIPVASRIGIGMRYFFTDNIGANLAIGVGQGGLINGGLSFKF